jgi:TRAP-type uncharacterized transport system substrate-binding protein
MRKLRSSLLSLRDVLATAGPLVLIALLLLVLAYKVLDPNPPRKLVLATGSPQGAYAEFGLRYAALLKANGIAVELRFTQGSAENFELLQNPDSGVDLAFIQGGSTSPPAQGFDDEWKDDGLVSLGGLFHEPVWLFYREASALKLREKNTLESLTQLQGFGLNIGAPGSGTPGLMLQLLEINNIPTSSLTLRHEGQTPAVMALLEGRTDAVAFASAPESLMVQMLLQTPGIRLFDFAQANAYSRRLPHLSAVTLPRGVVDLARDMPAQDIRLVAPTATLLARKNLHPALVQLVVQAARQIHSGAGWFQRKSEFPTMVHGERPLAKEAERFYRSGAPLLQRYLPFWAANLIDRMWVVIVSIVAILIPLSRVVPPLYAFRVRSRVFRWYAQLRAIEDSLDQQPRAALLQELAEIEARVKRISVPLSYADQLYALRTHIHLVRRRLLSESAQLVAPHLPVSTTMTTP